MRATLDKFMAWLHLKPLWLPKLGDGFYLTLPWGNDGRGTRVYLWPFVAIAIFLAATLIHNAVTK